MIFNPKPGQIVRVNYKVKSMSLQGISGEVVTVSKGPGPRNVLIKLGDRFDIIPRGNLILKTKGE